MRRARNIMKKQIAWIFGGAALVGLGMAGSLSACSGDNTKADAGGKDATTDTAKQDSGGQDAGNDVINDVNTADCKKVPANAPFTTDSGPFCPFGGDGSTFAPCNTGEHCCLPSTGSSTCSGTACVFSNDASTNSDFQCNETNDCNAGEVCCENAGSEVQQDPGCTTYDYVSKQHGTSCVSTSCPSGQAQVCGSDSDCPTGKTCFPTNTKAIWLGVCIGADGGI
jgi:hypothetical protein